MWQGEITDAELLLVPDEVEEEWHDEITDEEMITIDAVDDLPSSGYSNYMESVFTRSPAPPPPGGYPPLDIPSDNDDDDNEDDDDDEYAYLMRSE